MADRKRKSALRLCKCPECRNACYLDERELEYPIPHKCSYCMNVVNMIVKPKEEKPVLTKRRLQYYIYELELKDTEAVLKAVEQEVLTEYKKRLRKEAKKELEKERKLVAKIPECRDRGLETLKKLLRRLG